MSIPHHVAIIPDGNRRWAKERGLMAFDGHQRGISIFEEVASHAADCGVSYLSVWGMSVDNFSKRSAFEIGGLMRIFKDSFERLAKSDVIHSRQAHIQVIGRWPELFPMDTKRAIQHALDATVEYDLFHLTFLLGYSGADDMMQAIQALVRHGQQDASFMPNEDDIKQHLLTARLPAVDLVIRTAGDPHLSNGFMMWDTANAELYFTEQYWPDFSIASFDQALASFAQRRRRMGT